MKKIIFLAATLLNVFGLMAQSVNLANYYSSANGKKKAELKTALYNIIGSPDWQSYSSLWTHYYTTDRAADNQVIDRYSNTKRYFSSNNGNQVGGMNKEHGIPQSWWGGGTNRQGSDLHHVMPSDSEANSRKSNYGMGIVTNVNWQNGSIKVGTGTAGSSSISLWEPADEWKGDFARAYFYIVTCYEELNLAQSEGARSMQNNTYPKLQPWASQLYLQWAKEDPVSDLERARNEAVYQIQGNRNPFVDYQNLAEYIWGDSVDYAFNVNGGNNIEPTPTPPTPQPVELDSIDVIFADFTAQTAADYGFALLDINGEPSAIWTNNKAYGMVANAYNAADKSGDEWLISPAIDLTGMQGATLEFSHATGYNSSNDPSQMFQVLVSTDYEPSSAPQTATWQSLIVAWPDIVNSGYTKYASSGEISLDQFAGQAIHIAFNYRANSSRCWAWEIKGVNVKALPETAASRIEHYYATVQGLKKAQLKTALHDIIQPAYVLEYGGKGEGYTWSGFARTDNLGNGHIRDRYSNIDRTFKGLQAVDGMNIEHIWANSWWGHVVNNAYCDLFNLFPADASANGRKSNNPIGVVDGAIAFDNGVTRVGKSSSYRADSLITAWEPADKWKGDFARTYFYMATAYEHMTALWQTTEGLLTVDPSASWPLMRPWVYQLMLEWAENDPVDDIERARNDSVFAIQGNRNPYVDMPQLADYVWGDSTEFAFYINSKSIVPELFVPRSGSVIDFGLQSLQTEMNHKIVVRGRNLAGNLNVSLEDNNHSFSVSPATLTAAQVEAGAVITISRTATTAGPCTATLVLSDGNNLSHSVTLRMNVIDGIPAYDPASIVCNMNTKNFTACWKNMALAEGETYSLDVYTITNGERTSLSGYPVTTADTSYVVSGLKASTTYYYQVSAGSLTSNQVQVDMPAVKPVFSVSPNSVALTSQPGVPSRELRLSVTTLALSKYETSISCPAPFEVSADGENWSGELLLTTYNPSFYVRLGAVAAAGAYEGEMILTAPGVNELVVSLSAVVDEDKAFFENFESGTKGGYAEGSVTCNAATWTLANALLANDANAGGGRCVRMKIGGRLEMNEDKTEGCDSLSFYAGLYNKDTKPTLTVSYSLDGGQTWTPVVETLAFTNGEWKRYSYAIQQDGLIRLRFATQDGNENQRLNIDDIQMSNYKQSSSPDAISVIDADDVNSQTFMLDGRRVSKTASRGIYISGRKKFVK
ncbi:MAG: endonuclease [Bacteroidaceae bacterium]|nr:endonuclease [Bacteroidaceae bacterium]